MSDHRNQIILESLYQKYIDLGYEDKEAQELAAKEFEENSNQVYINCREIGETMTQHTEKVEQVRRRNRLDNWRKVIKFSLGETINNGEDVKHTTVYNDDSQTIEYLKSDRKTETIPSPHSDDDLVDLMMRGETATAEAIIRKLAQGEDNE